MQPGPAPDRFEIVKSSTKLLKNNNGTFITAVSNTTVKHQQSRQLDRTVYTALSGTNKQKLKSHLTY